MCWLSEIQLQYIVCQFSSCFHHKFYNLQMTVDSTAICDRRWCSPLSATSPTMIVPSTLFWWVKCSTNFGWPQLVFRRVFIGDWSLKNDCQFVFKKKLPVFEKHPHLYRSSKHLDGAAVDEKNCFQFRHKPKHWSTIESWKVLDWFG